MAKALFVFDHKYPVDSNGDCYYSSGFDEEFFRRYYSIFEQVDIWGRKTVINQGIEGKKIAYPSKFYLFSSNKKIAGLLGKMERTIKDYNCIIIRMPSVFGSIAIKKAKKLNKPYIVEIVSCEYDALSTSTSLKRRMMARPAELFYRYILKDNPYSVYVTKEFLQKKYPSNGKQVAISNVTLPSVDDSLLMKRMARYERFDPEKGLILGTCSTLDVDFKGQKYVIKALPRLIELGYNVKYKLVGDGDGSWLQQLAREYGVEDRVEIIGHLDHNSVFEWLDLIDLYVHPSCQEGLSRAIIEAMSRACPIIAADTGGVHELIDDEYIFPKRNSDAIVECVIKIITSGLQNQSIRNINNSKEYSMDKLYKKREDFFLEFMKERKIE